MDYKTNTTITVTSVKKCREKTKTKRDGKLLWVYAVTIEGDQRTYHSIHEVPLGELTVSAMMLKLRLISRPYNPKVSGT